MLEVGSSCVQVMLRPPQSNRRLLSGRVLKFSQAAMEAAFYGSFTLLGYAIVPSQPWIWPSKDWWIDFSSGTHSLMRNDLRCYYLLYGARYFQGAVSVLLEPKRKDFVEMVIHHLVTVAVVAISYLYGWNRVGAVVMLLLDPADVPLHVAKMLKYVSQARSKNRAISQLCAFAADRTFELFAVTFFVTRVAMFPYVRDIYCEYSFFCSPCCHLGVLVSPRRSHALLSERPSGVDMRRPPGDTLRPTMLLVFPYY